MKKTQVTEKATEQSDVSNINASVYTFVTMCGKHKVSIKPEFLKKGIDPTTTSWFELAHNHEIGTFQHNPTGPAMIHLELVDKYPEYAYEYWINGHRLSPEAQEKLKHDYKFNEDFMDLINKD